MIKRRELLTVPRSGLFHYVNRKNVQFVQTVDPEGVEDPAMNAGHVLRDFTSSVHIYIGVSYD